MREHVDRQKSIRHEAVRLIAQANDGLYDANFDPAILAAVTECKDLCYDYNQLRPSATDERQALLRTIVGNMGENATIVSPFWCDYGANICLGEQFYANHGLVILDGAPVIFGHDVYIAPCPGVTIGSNVVIGAGSVVTRDIPSGVVAVGNPCRVLRPITEADAERTSFGRG